jgi:hypothetical protein
MVLLNPLLGSCNSGTTTMETEALQCGLYQGIILKITEAIQSAVSAQLKVSL